MGWADRYVEALCGGACVRFRPRGGSMSGAAAGRNRVLSGQLVTVEPLLAREPAPGDAVLCRCGGRQYLHLVTATRRRGDEVQWQISNSHGRVNGWVGRDSIYGRLVSVEP